MHGCGSKAGQVCYEFEEGGLIVFFGLEVFLLNESCNDFPKCGLFQLVYEAHWQECAQRYRCMFAKVSRR